MPPKPAAQSPCTTARSHRRKSAANTADDPPPPQEAPGGTQAPQTPSRTSLRGGTRPKRNAATPKPTTSATRSTRTPRRRPINQNTWHEYTVDPAPQTGFLTLSYADKERFARALGGSWVHGQRDSWRWSLASGAESQTGVPKGVHTPADSGVDVNTPVGLLGVSGAGAAESRSGTMAPVLEPGTGKVQGEWSSCFSGSTVAIF